VRVFVPAYGAEPEPDLVGIVEHVGGETEEPFRGEDGLLEVVHRALGKSARGPGPGGDRAGTDSRPV